MNNQNVQPWAWGSGSGPPFVGSPPSLTPGFPQAGLAQNPLMPGYPQIYGGCTPPMPSNYSQWTTTQIQQWQQWQQWQQKYQQWQTQYGKKYVESLAAAVQGLAGIASDVIPTVGEPTEISVPSLKTIDPPLPTASLQSAPPLPPEEEKPPLPGSDSSRDPSRNGSQACRDAFEDLSEAEKAFDVQFKQWESQFTAWKKENQDHPDKAQYKEYEKKWEAWREQLLLRREQMRKKRLGQAVENTDNAIKSDEKKLPMPTREKPPDGEQKSQLPNLPPSLDSLSQHGSSNGFGQQRSQENNWNFNSRHGSSSNFSGFQDKDFNGAQFSSSPDINRKEGPFGTPSRNFDKGYHQGSNSRFGVFGRDSPNGNFGLRPRNPNQPGGPRFNNGKFDSIMPWQRFEQSECRSTGNFGSPSIFSGDNFRNEKELDGPRSGGNNRDKEGDKSFGDVTSRNTDTNDFRSGFGNSFSDAKTGQSFPPRPKVPSLFDITVEKPQSLMESNNEPKIWEMYNKDDSFDHKLKEKETERLRANNIYRNKGLPSPWLQPWEMDKLGVPTMRDIGLKDTGGPWLKTQEIDRAELSGYVGNLLAKLGQLSGLPSNLEKVVGGKNEEGNQRDSYARFGNSNSERNKHSELAFSVEKNRENSVSGKELLDRTPVDVTFPNGKELGRGEVGGTPRESIFLRGNFNRFEGDADRNFGRGNEDEGRFSSYDPKGPFRGEGKDSLSSEDSRNLRRCGPKEDWQNFGSESRFSRINDDWTFNRSSRPEKDFGRSGFRKDVDMRLGGNWSEKGSFDRFLHDENNSKGIFYQSKDPFVKQDRERGHSLHYEPVWKPQVFDYSQGRPSRVSEDDGFKISTVVDYSHGENKQAFNFPDEYADDMESKPFEYCHKSDATPTIIDYGHGFDKKSLIKDLRRDKNRENSRGSEEKRKNNTERYSRSPSKERFRSRSRSPHYKYRKMSESPSSFKTDRMRSRDDSDRQISKKRRKSSDEDQPKEEETSKHPVDVTTVSVEDLICSPGRETRPSKLVFLMRGIPGSGKTYVTKLIKDKEVEMDGDPPRILSLDDYFMTEVEKEIIDEETGRKVKTKVLEYEYEAAAESFYRTALVKAFKKTISDGFFSFVIVDSVNEKTKDYEEMWSFAKQKGFQVYVAEMDSDVAVCTARNIHKRSEKEISELAKNWEETPRHYLRLDVRSLIQSDAIAEVEMEVVSDTELDKCLEQENLKEKSTTEDENKNAEIKDNNEEDISEAADREKEEEEEDDSGTSAFVKSRWDQFENSEPNLDRLDGLKRCRERFQATMEDFLQLPDDWDEITKDVAPGKKKVRWADLEERRQQEKMRAIGFVVGQTDWTRMTDPTFGESALTKTKYI